MRKLALLKTPERTSTANKRIAKSGDGLSDDENKTGNIIKKNINAFQVTHSLPPQMLERRLDLGNDPQPYSRLPTPAPTGGKTTRSPEKVVGVCGCRL